MSKTLTLYAEEPEQVADLPSWLEFMPADDDNPHPSIRVFVDTMEYPAPSLYVPPTARTLSQTFYPDDHLVKGKRVYIEPCSGVEFAAVYVFALREGGLWIGRIIPEMCGRFKISYNHPAYHGFTIENRANHNLSVFARVLQEQPYFRYPGRRRN